MSPFNQLWRMPFAPSIPVSSVAVINTSTGPWGISFDNRIAIPVATPIPLSAPRVVPSAVTHSPSIYASIGSLVKSCCLSSFFWGTMSRWPCRITPLRFSIPGVAGLLNNILLASSISAWIPFSFAQFITNSLAFSSWFDGRGTWVSL